MESNDQTIERGQGPQYRRQQLYYRTPQRIARTVRHRPRCKPGRVPSIPLPERSLRILPAEQDTARSLQSINQRPKTRRSGHQTNSCKTFSDSSPSFDPVVPSTCRRSNTEILQEGKNPREQQRIRFRTETR